MRDAALQYLRSAVGNPTARFRDGQWESIESVLNRQRILVVQRTGWGKSMVYFVATRLQRDKGAGCTLLVSPLLSLMRNQQAAASALNLQAVSINSSNRDEWDDIQQRLQNDEIDVLLVSPERLGNEDFRQNVLPLIANNVGLFVVDEAHCISDWGHDFRPDYRRIVRIVEALPSNVPVLATTATANNRVVADIQLQIGDAKVQRGPLVRESLRLQNISMPSPAARFAWLAEKIPEFEGSGIVYTLTQRDAERVTEWLQICGINALSYHAGVEDREAREQALLANEVKVLVATVALGMGFDKPDIGFVVHFQRPSSVVHYYQQVGRAGRAVENALGILLHGSEDDDIADFFIRNAFPPQAHVDQIIQALSESDGGHSIPKLQASLNIANGQIASAIKYLSVESPSPIAKIGSSWNVTASAAKYQVDSEMVTAITKIRRDEQAEMQRYVDSGECLMHFLSNSLDDPNAAACGQCENCVGQPLIDVDYDESLAVRAVHFLRRSFQELAPRKAWPAHSPLPTYGFSGKIGDDVRASEGRALCLWRDAGWGEQVARDKYDTKRFDDLLVDACASMIEQWSPEPYPSWVTCVPSLNNPTTVPDFAGRLAAKLGLPFVDCVEKVRATPPQKEMQNSFQQASNLDGAFQVSDENFPNGACLLVDDIVDSRWTFTIIAALLRERGCEAVFPMALALSSPRMD